MTKSEALAILRKVQASHDAREMLADLARVVDAIVEGRLDDYEQRHPVLAQLIDAYLKTLATREEPRTWAH